MAVDFLPTQRQEHKVLVVGKEIKEMQRRRCPALRAQRAKEIAAALVQSWPAAAVAAHQRPVAMRPRILVEMVEMVRRRLFLGHRLRMVVVGVEVQSILMERMVMVVREVVGEDLLVILMLFLVQSTRAVAAVVQDLKVLPLQ